MRFDPFRFHRKSTRYSGWDYRTPGFYFITICTHKRQPLFEDWRLKEAAQLTWVNFGRNQLIKVDEHVFMPDHAHGIIEIVDFLNPKQTEPEPNRTFQNADAGSIGALVASYKGTSTERVNALRNSRGNPIWQRGYWDRIIRNEEELAAIRQYIRSNPERWEEDRDDLDQLLKTRMVFHKP